MKSGKISIVKTDDKKCINAAKVLKIKNASIDWKNTDGTQKV